MTLVDFGIFKQREKTGEYACPLSLLRALTHSAGGMVVVN
jgi:hypothetical protein